MKCEKWTDQLDTLVRRCFCDHTWWGAPHAEMLWFRNKTRVVANSANDWRPPHTWIPEGKRSRNWLKITFRKIVKTECKKQGLDWLKSVTWKIVKPWRIEDVTGQPYAPITKQRGWVSMCVKQIHQQVLTAYTRSQVGWKNISKKNLW